MLITRLLFHLLRLRFRFRLLLVLLVGCVVSLSVVTRAVTHMVTRVLILLASILVINIVHIPMLLLSFVIARLRSLNLPTPTATSASFATTTIGSGRRGWLLTGFNSKLFLASDQRRLQGKVMWLQGLPCVFDEGCNRTGSTMH